MKTTLKTEVRTRSELLSLYKDGHELSYSFAGLPNKFFRVFNYGQLQSLLEGSLRNFKFYVDVTHIEG